MSFKLPVFGRSRIIYPLEGISPEMPIADRIIYVLGKQTDWTQLRDIAALADLESSQVSCALNKLPGIEKRKTSERKGAPVFVRLRSQVQA
jgi:hypothetical protein